MTSQITKLTEEIIAKLSNIARKHDHRFLTFSKEFVRQYGDQIDSRFKVVAKDNEIEIEATLWIEGNGTVRSETVYSDIEDYDFYEEFEKLIKSFNKDFKKELIERDADEEED